MAQEKQQNLQDTFLNHVRKQKIPVTVFLVNGVKLQGVITWFDNFCVLLRRDGMSQLVYKHAISTIMPGGPIRGQASSVSVSNASTTERASGLGARSSAIGTSGKSGFFRIADWTRMRSFPSRSHCAVRLFREPQDQPHSPSISRRSMAIDISEPPG